MPSISSTFYAHVFAQNVCAKNYKAAQSTSVQNFGAKNELSYEKRACKTLMKLTPYRC